jgi:hypothetical protein
MAEAAPKQPPDAEAKKTLKAELAIQGPQAMSEYKAERDVERAKTARLRTL